MPFRKVPSLLLGLVFILSLGLITVPASNASQSLQAKGSASQVAKVSARAAVCTYTISKGPNCSRYVMLTYDDCPKTWVSFRDMVLYVSSHGFGMVVFPTGNCITKFKGQGYDLVGYARAHGIWVANHSVSHPDLRTLSYANMVKQLKAPGVVTNVGRPPYGAYNTTVSQAYASVGMLKWLWNVDTNDWRSKTRAQVVSYVVANTKAGQTVLMHLQWNGFSPTAFGQMAVGLYKKGLLVCRVYRGPDNTGAIVATPQNFPSQIPCGL